MYRRAKLLLSVSMMFVVLFAFTGFAYAEWNKAAQVTGDNVNLRAKPNTSADVLTKIDKGSNVNIISESDGWYNVSFGGKKGWVSAQFVKVSSTAAKTGKILAEDVNLRSSASTSSKVVTKLDKGENVSVIETSGDWLKVKTSDNNTGWVHKDFISATNSNVSRGSVTRTESQKAEQKKTAAEPKKEEVKKEEVKTPEKEEKKSSDSSKGQEMVDYAKQFLGVKYVYGASSPKGFDCSGFTSYVYKHFGFSIERVAANQAGQGKKVNKSDLKPGDLVFFDTNGGHNYINHVGLYIGDGQFIHASSGSKAKKVIISDLTSGFYDNAFMTASRFLD